MATNDKTTPAEQLNVIADLAKTVPKLVTKVAVAKASNGNVIMSLIFELPGETPMLIERVILDDATVVELVKILVATEDKGGM